MVRAILRSNGEDELKYPELRQIIGDLIEEFDFKEKGIDLFIEDKCETKDEYIKKIRTDGEY